MAKIVAHIIVKLDDDLKESKDDEIRVHINEHIKQNEVKNKDVVHVEQLIIKEKSEEHNHVDLTNDETVNS